jgi:hypothetical protein
MQGMISLSDALRVMAARDEAGDPIPFEVKVVTLNLKHGTGGMRVAYQNATLAGGSFGKKNALRQANHFYNGTRNLMVPGRSRPVKIHNLLITHFNGERVFV